MVFNAAPCIQHYTRPLAFLFSAPASHPLVARLAIPDALRRPRERDSYGEIELNLEMNIESNELSTYQPASQPATTPVDHPPTFSASSACRDRLASFVLAFGAFLRSPIGAISTRFQRNLFICAAPRNHCSSGELPAKADVSRLKFQRNLVRLLVVVSLFQIVGGICPLLMTESGRERERFDINPKEKKEEKVYALIGASGGNCPRPPLAHFGRNKLLVTGRDPRWKHVEIAICKPFNGRLGPFSCENLHGPSSRKSPNDLIVHLSPLRT